MDNISPLPKETQIVKTENYGHAKQLLGGITIQQQKEIYKEAYEKKPFINLSKLIKERYGLSHLHQIRTEQFATVLKTVQKERQRIEPLWEQAQQMAEHPLFKQRNQNYQKFLVGEIARRLGAHENKYAVAKDSAGFVTQHLCNLVDQLFLFEQGVHPIYKVVNAGHTLVFVQEKDLRTWIKQHLQSFLPKFEISLDLEDEEELQEWQEWQSLAKVLSTIDFENKGILWKENFFVWSCLEKLSQQFEFSVTKICDNISA